jgi:hypothetical protein
MADALLNHFICDALRGRYRLTGRRLIAFSERQKVLNHLNKIGGVWVRHTVRTQGRADVRFAAHNGLNADVALSPKSAKFGHNSCVMIMA